MHSQINLELPCPRLCLGVLISTRKKLLLLRIKGVDEGLTSLYLHCLGIETMPVHRQHSLFESIFYEIAVSFSSSSLERLTVLTRVEYHKGKQGKTKFYCINKRRNNSRQTEAMH